MISSEKPSPGEGKRGLRKWDYLPVPNGKSAVGFIAGPVCGCWTHHANGTKPCKRRMTKGKLRCAFCDEKFEQVWRGAVPFYDREYVRRFVWITEDYFEATMEIELHRQIVLSREKDTHAPVVIRAEAWRTTPMPVSKDRIEPVELMPFLVHILWKDEELANYVEQKPIAELVEGIGGEEKSRRRTIVDTIGLALGDRAGEVDKVRHTRNAEFAKEAKKAERNGNGKPHPT